MCVYMLSHKLRYRADKEYAFKTRARSYRRSLLLGIIKRPSPQMIQRYGITDEELEIGRAACERANYTLKTLNVVYSSSGISLAQYVLRSPL